MQKTTGTVPLVYYDGLGFAPTARIGVIPVPGHRAGTGSIVAVCHNPAGSVACAPITPEI